MTKRSNLENAGGVDSRKSGQPGFKVLRVIFPLLRCTFYLDWLGLLEETKPAALPGFCVRLLVCRAVFNLGTSGPPVSPFLGPLVLGGCIYSFLVSCGAASDCAYLVNNVRGNLGLKGKYWVL